jgi:predicted RNase H-like HicB family nuclease
MEQAALMNGIVFEVSQESDGGFVAECLTEGIFTQADNWEELRRNVKEAVSAYYFDRTKQPAAIRLHLVRDEVLANP